MNTGPATAGMHTKFKIIKDKLSDIFRMATWLGNIPHHRKTISWGFCLDQTAVYTKQWDQVWNGKSFMMNYCNTLGIHDWLQQVSLNNNMEKNWHMKKKWHRDILFLHIIMFDISMFKLSLSLVYIPYCYLLTGLK